MSPSKLAAGAQTLFIDADDTLWENHAHFIETIERYFELMGDRGHSRELTNSTLETIERQRTATRGYGSRFFALSLGEAYERLEGELPGEIERKFHNWGEQIFHAPITPFPGVLETLEELSSRHRLILMTKGAPEEQLGKLARSGLAPLFPEVRVLHQKNAQSYREAIRSLDPVPELDWSWMIGNSPRSDINPARDVGLRTVFIPHRTIWELEKAGLSQEPDLTLRRFYELCDHF